MNTLKAEKRDMTMKAKRLRREGYVTGNVFGKAIKGSITIKIEKREAERMMKTSKKGSQIKLEIDGEPMDVLIKEIAYNALKSQVDEIDFQALVTGEKVHSVAEIILINQETVTGGVIQQLLQEIAFKAVPAELVEKVEVDAGSMKAGDTIRVKDLAIAANKNIELITSPDTLVATVTMPRGMEPTAEEAGTSAE